MFFVQKKDSGGFKDSSTRIQVDSERDEVVLAPNLDWNE
jgi:hypothetical protein